MGLAGLAEHCSVSNLSRVQPWVQLDYLNIVLPKFRKGSVSGSAGIAEHCSASSSARVQLDDLNIVLP